MNPRQPDSKEFINQEHTIRESIISIREDFNFIVKKLTQENALIDIFIEDGLMLRIKEAYDYLFHEHLWYDFLKIKSEVMYSESFNIFSISEFNNSLKRAQTKLTFLSETINKISPLASTEEEKKEEKKDHPEKDTLYDDTQTALTIYAKDASTGETLLRIAANQGYPKAQCELGKILLQIEKLKETRNPIAEAKEGIIWLNKAKQQDPLCALNTEEIVGYCYLRGVGVSVNPQIALHYLRRYAKISTAPFFQFEFLNHSTLPQHLMLDYKQGGKHFSCDLAEASYWQFHNITDKIKNRRIEGKVTIDHDHLYPLLKPLLDEWSSILALAERTIFYPTVLFRFYRMLLCEFNYIEPLPSIHHYCYVHINNTLSHVNTLVTTSPQLFCDFLFTEELSMGDIGNMISSLDFDAANTVMQYLDDLVTDIHILLVQFHSPVRLIIMDYLKLNKIYEKSEIIQENIDLTHYVVSLKKKVQSINPDKKTDEDRVFIINQTVVINALLRGNVFNVERPGLVHEVNELLDRIEGIKSRSFFGFFQPSTLREACKSVEHLLPEDYNSESSVSNEKAHRACC